MLVSTGLVLLMVPGLALFYGGMVRHKNVLGTMMQSMVALGLIGTVWLLFGYALAFGDSQSKTDQSRPAVGFGNGLMLGYLMYKSGLVPRPMAMLGLIGGPLLIISFVMILFGVYDNGPGPAGLMAAPEIAWEASLGIYAAWKGFRPSPITATIDLREETATPSMAMT